MLKLLRLPDRTPVKLTISTPPELNEALKEYAAVYQEAYGASEPVAELVPAMLPRSSRAIANSPERASGGRKGAPSESAAQTVADSAHGGTDSAGSRHARNRTV